MSLFKLKTLRARIMVPSLILPLLLFAGLGFMLVQQSRQQAQALIATKGESLANLLGKISAAYIVNYDSRLPGSLRPGGRQGPGSSLHRVPGQQRQTP
jgi:hypothetical protein